MSISSRTAGVAIAAALLPWQAVAQQASGNEAVAAFYRGRNITIVVSSPPGGGYDMIARAAGRHLSKYMVGSPAVIVQNMPGAGGIVATNYLYSVAAKDGTVIGQLQPNTAFEPLMGTKSATYDPLRFNWLGSPAYETGVFTVWHGTGVKSLDDARKRELSVGVPGIASGPSLYARLMRDTLGLKIKLIAGYQGQSDSQLAMERGETDAYPNFYNNIVAFRPQWLKEGKLVLLVQYGPEKEPALPDVPFAPDLAATPEDRALMEMAFAPLALGRPFVAPPDVEPARVAALRSAFVADLEKGGLKVNSPRSGARITETIAAAYRAPAARIERLRRLQDQ